MSFPRSLWRRLVLLPFLLSSMACVADHGRVADADGGADPIPPPLVVDGPHHHLDVLAREPMLARHPSGALFVAGYGSQVTGTDPEAVPNLWRSDDRGVSWQRVAVGSSSDGAAGNSDVDLAVAPDGTLYFIVMGFDRAKLEGTHIAVGASPDGGATWTWTRLSQDRRDDRPWVEVAPDGAAHAIWNDGQGVCHALSTDRGLTWRELGRIHPHGGSSHLAIGPGGELAARITPLSASGNAFDEGVDLIAVSTDAGASWRTGPAPGSRDWGWQPGSLDPQQVPRWVEPLAWDGSGALYSLWSEGRRIMLARSRDQGRTWQQWPIADEEHVAYFPYLIATRRGGLAATWFVGQGEPLAAAVVTLTFAGGDGDAAPGVRRAPPLVPESWRAADGEPTRDAAGEYLPLLDLGEGELAVVSPIQDAAHERFGFTWWRISS